MQRASWIAALALILSLAVPAGAGAVDVDGIRMEAASPNGDHAYFASNAVLAEGDGGPSRFQLYRYDVGAGLTSIDLGPSDLEGQESYTNAVVQVADDGRAIVNTAGRASPEDTDLSPDLYLVDGNELTLLTPFDAPYEEEYLRTPWFFGASEDLSIVYFLTAEPLAAGDVDDRRDLYRVEGGGSPELVSGGAVPSASADHVWRADSDMQLASSRSRVVSADGQTVVFMTKEQLVQLDDDANYDLYMSHRGELSLATPDLDPTDPSVETGGRLGIGSVNPDERRILFASIHSYLPTDGDPYFDWYLWNQDHLELVTDAPRTSLSRYAVNFDDATFVDDGRAIFESHADLLPGDVNQDGDVYAYEDGQLSIAARDNEGRQPAYSPNPVGVNPATREVYGMTFMAADPNDAAGDFDIYAMSPRGSVWRSSRTDGTDGTGRVQYLDVSDDGSTVAFYTSGALAPGDDDCVPDEPDEDGPGGCTDLYVSGRDGTELVSGAYGEQHDQGNACITVTAYYCRDTLRAVSTDGRRVYFESTESLVPEDTAHLTDVYLWQNGKTRLVSTGEETEWWPTANLEDTRPPDTWVTDGVEDRSTPEVQFSFRTDEPRGASFECRMDEGAWSACEPGHEYRDLAEGSHRFEVRGIDTAGNRDPIPAYDNFTVDNAPPNTWITRWPEPDGAGGYEARFYGDKDRSTFECRIDSGPFEPCSARWSLPHLPSGYHDLAVRAVDLRGTVDSSPATTRFLVQNGTPETTIRSGPNGITRYSDLRFAFESDFVDADFYCKFDNGPWVGCLSPETRYDVSDGPHSFAVRAEYNGAVDSTPEVRNVVVDTSPPNTTITRSPEGSIDSNETVFEFAADQGGAQFRCRLDAGDWHDCESPRSYTRLADGPHRFEVSALNAGRSDPSPAVREFVVSVPNPETTIDGGRLETVRSSSHAFSFSSSPAGGTFRCRLDSGSARACESPYELKDLTDGRHRFEVEATRAGKTDPTPAVFEFDVQAPPPDTLKLAGPDGVVRSRSSSFHFSSDQPGSSFQCKLDDDAPFPCRSPVGMRLNDGPHELRVTATRLGRTDPTPALWSFTVDTTEPDLTPPETMLHDWPARVSADRSVRFAFGSSDPGATFECSLDDSDFASCESPLALEPAEGGHVFAVRAVDAAGNWDQSPSRTEFELDWTGPVARIESGPVGTVRADQAIFSISSGEPEGRHECAVDAGPFYACDAAERLPRLRHGEHALRVRGVDDLGNLGPPSAPWRFAVDAIAPNTRIGAHPQRRTKKRSAQFTIHSEPRALTECRLDGGPWLGCAGGITTPRLGIGPHIFEARATDEVGNVETTPARWRWAVRRRKGGGKPDRSQRSASLTDRGSTGRPAARSRRPS